MLSGIQLWFYGTDHMFLSRQSTTTSFEGTPIDPIVPSDYNVVKPVTAIAYFNSQLEANTLISVSNSAGTTG